MKIHINKWIKRIGIVFAAFIAVFFMTSCTNSFCSNLDQANQYWAYYGDLYSEGVDVSEGDAEETDVTEEQNSNRETLYSTIESYGFTRPSKVFNAYMSERVDEFVEEYYVLFYDGTLSSQATETAARNIAKHVGIYAGIEQDEDGSYSVSDIWSNYDVWYQDALYDSSVGVDYTPSEGFVTLFKSTTSSTVSGNTACITPSSGYYTQDNVVIYIEGKSWGEAFSEYGFLEGLLVYPFACIIHYISEGLGGSGGAQIFAIFVLTLLARLVTMISTLVQNNTNTKQMRIQPQLNALKKKYPDSDTDKEQRNAMAMEQSQIMKANKVHPFLPLLFMILQFPIFICVWSALQGSATLASSSFFGLPLTTTVSECISGIGTIEGAWVGVVVFVLMALGNIMSSTTSMSFNSWRQKNFGAQGMQTSSSSTGMDPQKTTKWMTIIMMVFVIIMGYSLPVAMGIYWFIGSVISIAQALLTEALQTHSRHKIARETGDGSDLAAIRRSKHHMTATATSNTKQSSKTKSIRSSKKKKK